ncbi:MAG: PhoH family protein [Bacteroidales bacterium]|jgi:PhoH-like ATPase|nr:PhoH family protein [Bacteroidales bacterium]MCI2121150.1 PhoH family protein [Bacteroidales bacterium]MCI2144739.1 PhoH family protein [Bacteroidales bacterium]
MAKKKLPKIFVLDTNVILHDCMSIYHFQENDIVIPITVIEELDKFKKGNEATNYNAREFAREMEKISSDSLYDGGLPLGKGLGKMKVELGHPYTPEMKESLIDDTPDHRILAIADWVKSHNTDRTVILVSKDMNLRMKAKALGVMAQDYLSDNVKEEHLETIRHEVETLTDVPDAFINGLAGTGKAEASMLKAGHPFAANNLVRLEAEGTGILARYKKSEDIFVNVKPVKAYGIFPRNDEQTFALDAALNPEVQLVSLTGTAGTGKTLIALAAALAQEDKFEQIILARPVIPLQNQDIGFLPGTAEEKVSPYMLPLFDNLSVIRKSFRSDTSKEVVRIEDMLRRNKLVISPLAYIRGRSLNDVFFIIDEAQNLTPHEVKTIITRAGENTKLVFTGDICQIDSPYLDIHSNGLSYLTEKLFGQEIFEHVNLVKGERSVLSELAGRLL